MKENDKELLYQAHIIIDLKKRYIDDIKRYGLGTVLMILIFIVYIAIITDKTISTITFPVILCTVFFGLLCALMSALFIYNIYKYFSTPKNFKIEIDKLVNKEIVRRVRKRHVATYKYLYFSNGRRFQVIPTLSFSPKSGDFHTWSKFNEMDEFEFFNTINPGDEVYLITHKGKIAYIYYAKYFELSDELKSLL